jgi:hypothetical protein
MTARPDLMLFRDRFIEAQAKGKMSTFREKGELLWWVSPPKIRNQPCVMIDTYSREFTLSKPFLSSVYMYLVPKHNDIFDDLSVANDLSHGYILRELKKYVGTISDDSEADALEWLIESIEI